MAELARQGVSAVQLDVSLLEQSSYGLTSAGLQLVTDDGEFLIAAQTEVRGWLRRIAPPDWRRDVAANSHDGAVRASWVSLLLGIAHLCPIKWLTPIERLFIAENKLVQHAAATALGIPTAATAVVSDRDRIPAALGARIVAKPLGPAQFDDRDGKAHIVFANELTRDSRELDALGGAPFLLQELLPATRHLRVVTLADRSWIASLDADELPLDWRRADHAHDAFSPTDEHVDVGQMALALAQSLGVGYSSQDWVVVDGGVRFLDLNPSGQWLFLPEPIASEVTAALVSWLSGNNGL